MEVHRQGPGRLGAWAPSRRAPAGGPSRQKEKRAPGLAGVPRASQPAEPMRRPGEASWLGAQRDPK